MYGGLFKIFLFLNPANIFLHKVSKEDSLNDIPSNLPSTFYGFPLFVAPRILVKH